MIFLDEVHIYTKLKQLCIKKIYIICFRRGKNERSLMSDCSTRLWLVVHTLIDNCSFLSPVKQMYIIESTYTWRCIYYYNSETLSDFEDLKFEV